MFNASLLVRRSLTVGLAACLLASAGSAPAATETVLYAFTGGNDGAYPVAGLVADSYGNLYGTTSQGGAWNNGVVFRVSQAGGEAVLHAFTGGTDGANPQAGLIIDGYHNLYGTTVQGGAWGQGVAFRLRPSLLYRAGWTETVLHAFGAGTDGAFPYAGLTRDAAGNLYGTTQFGGAAGLGTAFEIAPNGTETVLHSFPGGNDGMRPTAGVTIGANGTLYGTTLYGGTGVSGGTIYELVPPAQGQTAWSEAVLHSFAVSDGVLPSGGLIIDSSGNLYGTATEGGVDGTAYELSPPIIFPFAARGHRLAASASPSPNYDFFTWHLTVLHTFTGPDGNTPFGSLVADASGNLYGTTFQGGAFNCGTVYEIAPNSTETILYSFACGNDGAYPLAGLILDASGNLYGTTSAGGPSGAGVVFKIQP